MRGNMFLSTNQKKRFFIVLPVVFVLVFLLLLLLLHFLLEYTLQRSAFDAFFGALITTIFAAGMAYFALKRAAARSLKKP